jgi:ABC-type glutathione transport system ATPase component
MQALIQVTKLTRIYERRHPFLGRKDPIRALQEIDLEIPRQSALALVGESGSGKSTLARCLALLERPDGGEIWYAGRDLLKLSGDALFGAHREIQLIFQDSATALNPRLTARDIISEPLVIQKLGTHAEQRELVASLMEQVGLRAKWLDRKPHEFSGGQRQRLAIARALALRPRFLILDEALGNLDLSVQAQMVNLLRQLQELHGLTYLLISHDLSLVSAIADEIAVLHEGRLVEQGKAANILRAPCHPMTRALVAAIPGQGRAFENQAQP